MSVFSHSVYVTVMCLLALYQLVWPWIPTFQRYHRYPVWWTWKEFVIENSPIWAVIPMFMAVFWIGTGFDHSDRIGTQRLAAFLGWFVLYVLTWIASEQFWKLRRRAA